MHNDLISVDPGAAGEESVGAKDDNERQSLVHTVVPAVGSGQKTARADEGTTADTLALTELHEKSSLGKK